jgi:hypothetical protein
MDAKQCPHCTRWCLKDTNCNYVVCGRTSIGVFAWGQGCGRPFCFECGGKLCGLVYDHNNRDKPPSQDEDHNHYTDVVAQAICSSEGFCRGGHNSHKDKI